MLVDLFHLKESLDKFVHLLVISKYYEAIQTYKNKSLYGFLVQFIKHHVLLLNIRPIITWTPGIFSSEYDNILSW